MGTLAYILLIMGAFLPFIGMFIILIGGMLFENGACVKIGLYLLLISIICFIGSAIAEGFVDDKKTERSETEITEEKIVKVVETKKEPVIDTTIVIKNGVADTTFTYKFKK